MKQIRLSIFTFLSVSFWALACFSQQRMVYAWQEYTGNEDDESVVAYIYEKTAKQSPKVLVEGGIYPSISSDGQELIYSEKRSDGHYVIVVKNLVTGVKKKWSNAGFNLMASFSGNGRYITYSGPVGPETIDRNGNKSKENRIVVIDRQDNQAKIEIIPSQYKSYFPKLSSDGRYVVFHESYGKPESEGSSKRARNKRVVIYDRHTKEQLSITPEEGYCFEPAISKDDRYIAAVCRVTENAVSNDDIYVYDRLNLSEPPQRITQQPGFDYAPTFKPDGSIVFSSDEEQRSHEFRLFEAKLSSEGAYNAPSLIFAGEGVHYVPSFSGDLNMQQSFNSKEMVQARSSFGFAQIQDGWVVMGGNQGKQHDHSSNAIVSSTEILNADGTWLTVKNLQRPNAAQGFELFFYNNKLFAMGGRIPDDTPNANDQFSLDTVDVYDISSETWSSLPLAEKRSSYAASQIGSKVYLLYGWLSGTWMQGSYVGNGEVFDLETGETEIFELPKPYRRGFASTVWNNKIILVGGFADGKLLTNVDLFDPETMAVENLPPLPFGSFSPTAAVVGNTLYAFGGVFPYGKSMHRDALYVNHIYKLDLANPAKGWVHTGRYMRESKAFLRGLLDNNTNQIHLLGGHSFELGRENSLPVTTHEIWNIK
ncbi:MAG TPA: hypothetical protein PKC21_02885 [Oligoflexia bacterium]|nr:hypothetical protein [Oligoflexia bacterium]HMR24278.1 hypothetical protein [Oligoflexia bacterium]